MGCSGRTANQQKQIHETVPGSQESTFSVALAGDFISWLEGVH